MKAEDLIEEGVIDALRSRKAKFYEDLSEVRIRMGLNENFLVDKFFSHTILMEAAQGIDVRKYPVTKGGRAVKAISEELGIWEDELIVGNGSDEILDLVAKVFVGRGEALIVDPTFEMYRFYVSVSGGSARSVLTDENFEIRGDNILNMVSKKTKAIFICSPNNPTGRQYQRDEILKVVKDFEGIVVLDEAYVDFAPYSLMMEAPKYPNLLVLRTFSKAYGLAGLRIGYGVGDSDLIKWLRSAQSPFSVNSVAQEACRLVLKNRKVYDAFIKMVVEEREYLMAELEMINSLRAYPSSANFILVRVIDPAMPSSEVCRSLRKEGIEVRDRGELPLLENCFRVTVGRREDNLKFVESLKRILGGE
ncbi:MAG: histidinol-phosphate transaminase [Candidatus Methanomethyliaceae archaeon]|nr:histidinol-phosphate transaminase [Candidatus Methanomethyliaceae archaeon]